MVKCYLTEAMRSVTNDAMDVVAGAGISLGPRNILGLQYSVLPIGITVEGANILTRTMIIFGQGAMRCHPFVQDEMRGAAERDVELFDRGFFGHVGFVGQSAARALLLGLCDAAIARAPVRTPAARYYRKLTRLSAIFALCADFAMGTLGGSLKRKEMLTGRLADCLAWQYMASAALKRFHDEGSKERDLPYLRWACEHALHEGQKACLGFVQNLPLRPAGWFLRGVCFPLGPRWRAPGDRLTHRVAAGLLDGGEAREHLTRGIYLPPAEEPGLGLLEHTLAEVVGAQGVHDKVRKATREGRLERKPRATLLQRALESGVIDEQELARVEAAESARLEATAVDAFSQRDYAEMSA
jgi:acyl-CoA dehydrogenase